MNLRKIKSILIACIEKDNWKHIKECDVLLVCHDDDRGYLFRNRHYSQLIDSVGDLLKKNGLSTSSVAMPFSRLVKNKAYGDPIAVNRAFLFEQISLRLFRDLKLNYIELIASRQSIWETILKASKPRIVIGIQPSRELCRICNDFSIPIFDLQHGIISHDNPYYEEMHKSEVSLVEIPAGFLCWDDTSANLLRKWIPQKGDFVYTIGNPWFRRFQTDNSKDILIKDIRRSEIFKRNNKKNILVSLQFKGIWYTDGFVRNGIIPDALEEAIVNTATIYNWYIRLHPVQILGDEYAFVKKYLYSKFGCFSNVEWEYCSRMPIPIVLNNCDVHITYSSSTTIEAAWMGVPTALLNPKTQEGGRDEDFFLFERSLGLVETVSLDSKNIENWLHTNLEKGKSQPILKNYDESLFGFINLIRSLPRISSSKFVGDGT